MKSSLSRLFVLLSGLFFFVHNASAQSLSPDIATKLRDRAMAIHGRIETTKSFVGPINKSQMNSGEARVVDEILPKIESLLLEAADLFSKASETLPGWEGQECLRKGCGKLREAQQKIHEARGLLRMDGVLHDYAEMLEEIKQDIRDAVEDAGCRRANNPWSGKNFRSDYSNAQGRWVSGHTQINDGSGFYDTNSGEHGTLERISYRDNARVAEGYWRFQNGSTGWFSFTLNGDGRSFFGSWGNGDRIGQNQVGTWKGSL